MNIQGIRDAFEGFIKDAETEIRRELKAEKAKGFKDDQKIEQLKKDLDAERRTIRGWQKRLALCQNQMKKLMLDLSEITTERDDIRIKLNRLEDMERLGQLKGE